MKKQIIACKTLEQEITYVLQKHNATCNVKWIESGLHNHPEKLHEKIQEEIRCLKQCEQLILIFGNCGNAISKLQNGNFQMILPKVSDCISLLFGSDHKRLAYERKESAYFLTDGWMKGERNLWVEYQYTVEKYGFETAQKIAKMMYGNYRTLALLDCGVYPMNELMEDTKKIEDVLGLKRKVVKGSLERLEQLIFGPWDEEKFYLIAPYDCVP